MHKGKFIVFEGIEASGKSTQTFLLSEYIIGTGRDVCVTREPGGTSCADKIRNILVQSGDTIDALTEFLLFSAARRDHTISKILPALNNGNFVISDRYYGSSVVYQGYIGGVNREFINSVTNTVIDGFEPDLTIVIDLDPKFALERIKSRKHVNSDMVHYDNKPIIFHDMVRRAFLDLAKQNSAKWIIIDGSMAVEAVHHAIKDAVISRFF